MKKNQKRAPKKFYHMMKKKQKKEYFIEYIKYFQKIHLKVLFLNLLLLQMIFLYLESNLQLHMI